MESVARTADPWPRLLARIVAYDLILSPSLVIFWSVLLGVADPRVLVALLVIRFPLLIASLQLGLGAARVWHRERGGLDDRELLEADRSLRTGRHRFAIHYSVGMLICLTLATLLTVVGLPDAPALGRADLIIAAVFGLSLGVTIIPIIASMLDRPLLETRLELGAELRARGLEQQREPSTIVTPLVALNVASCLGPFVCATAVGGMLYIRGQRDELATELRRRAEVGALQVRLDGVARDAELRVIETLPAMLGEIGEIGEVVAAHDLTAGRTLAAAPLGDGRWLLASAALDEHLRFFLLFLIAVPLAMAAPLVGSILSVTRSLATQLRELRGATCRVAEAGELRSTARVVALDNDEIGELARDFNAMLDMFEELADAAALVAEGELRIELERPGDLHDAFRSMVARLHEVVVHIREAAVEVATAAGQLRSVARSQEQGAERQSTDVREIGTSADSLADSARDIARAAKNVLLDAEQSLTTADGVSEKIAALRTEVEGVTDLLELIREVADRSDLLALNGALEATRAGEAGRGFALVAAEMRRLAERVTEAVAEVRGHVTGIEAAGASTVAATDASRRLTQRTAAAARTISSLTERQSQDTEQVSRTIRGAAELAGATASATAQTRDAARSLAEEAERLERLTGIFRLGPE